MYSIYIYTENLAISRDATFTKWSKCGFIRGTSIQLPLLSSFVFFPTASGPKEPFDS